MKQKPQAIALGVLLVILVLVWYSSWSSSPEFRTFFGRQREYQPMKLDNPTLRLDLLEQARAQDYTGTHRNIFSATPPPPPQPERPPQTEEQAKPPEPTGPPPLAVPYRFFGYATDPRNGARRAFFTAGDEIFIVAEGGVIQGRFRLLRIGNTAADVEEIASGRKATLPLEQPQG